MKVEVKLSGADGIISLLKSLPAEVVSKRGGPVKLALAKGARLLRDEARKNAQAAIAQGGDESTGLLVPNIISSRGKAPTSGKGERYLVRVKRKTYPNRKGETVTTHKTAHLLEYGSSKQPATPWLRPAVQQKGAQVIDVIVTDLRSRLDKIVAKLAAQNRGR